MATPDPGLLDKLKALVGGAKVPEAVDPGPSGVGPTTFDKSGQGLIPEAPSAEMLAEMWKWVDRATARTDAYATKWDILLNEYLPIVLAGGTSEDVRVPMHFRNVHSKIGQLFYRSPDLILTARDPGPANDEMPNPMQSMLPPGMPPLPPLHMEDVIAVKQQVLQSKLGREGLKANRLMDELLFDVMAWAGIGCSKLGYHCVMKPIQKPKLGPPQMPQQPGGILNIGQPPPAQTMAPGGQAMAPPQMVPQIGPDGQPLMETVQTPVFEDYYWRRFSPKKLILDDDLHSTRYDEDSTRIGMHFYLSKKRAMKELGLTEEEANKASTDERMYKYVEDTGSEGNATQKLVHGIEVFCKSSFYTDEVHPQGIHQLVLIEGIKDKAFVWRPSPDQEFDPMTGQLTKDSLIGFPIRVLAIRDLADSPFPRADSAFTNGEIKQITTFRKQSVQLRDAAIGKYAYDEGAVGEEDLPKLKNGQVGEWIAFQEGKLANGIDKVIAPIAQVHATADDYRGESLLKQDVNETLGISANQAGTPEATVRTATEIAGVSTAVAARNDKERGRVTDFYLDGARMIDSLLMRYATVNDYILITGKDGAQRMQLWNNQLIQGRYLYDIAPDSQNQVDTEEDFLSLLKFYNLAAKDPLFNRPYVLRRLSRMRGLDPGKVVLDPMQMLQQPPHGGPGGAVNEHQQSNSGKRQNEPGAQNARDTEVK